MNPNENQPLAQHLLSLATLYLGRRKFSTALQLLRLSIYYHENNSRARYLLGRVFLQQAQPDAALMELQKAKELDPFFEDVYRQLGLIYLDKQNATEALQSFMDGYVLSGGNVRSRNSFYQQHIQKCFQALNIAADKDQYNTLFSQRKDHFQQLAAEVVSRGSAEPMSSSASEQVLFHDIQASDLSAVSSDIALSALRKFDIMKALDERELQSIAAIAEVRTAEMGEIISRDGDLTDAIHFIDQGSVRIIKNTPHGELVFASLAEGDLIGEVDFIDSMRCSADAVASVRSTLLTISKTKLEDMFLNNQHVAVQFYWYFWKVLSQRIRLANELLKSFFVHSSTDVEERQPLPDRAVRSTVMNMENKMAVLKERGLSSNELRLIAAFSNEELYRRGETIFIEGEAGDTLYIVLDGQVRISKFIPGGGEEALAILNRGDVFGEMALIDGSPRSADAVAHTDTTVLPIERRLLTDLLARDAQSSYEFLHVLCKVLARRLREINAKIYSWRMMSGEY